MDWITKILLACLIAIMCVLAAAEIAAVTGIIIVSVRGH